MDDEIDDVTLFKSIPVKTSTIKVIGKDRSDKLIAAAERAGYLKALEDVESKLAEGNLVSGYVLNVLEGMKREYEEINRMKSAHGGEK